MILRLPNYMMYQITLSNNCMYIYVLPLEVQNDDLMKNKTTWMGYDS